MLWLRWRSLLLLVMLLMNNARGSRLLQMVRRWRTLLRVVGMMVITSNRDTGFLFVSTTLSMGHGDRVDRVYVLQEQFKLRLPQRRLFSKMI